MKASYVLHRPGRGQANSAKSLVADHQRGEQSFSVQAFPFAQSSRGGEDGRAGVTRARQVAVVGLECPDGDAMTSAASEADVRQEPPKTEHSAEAFAAWAKSDTTRGSGLSAPATPQARLSRT